MNMLRNNHVKMILLNIVAVFVESFWKKVQIMHRTNACILSCAVSDADLESVPFCCCALLRSIMA